MVQAGYITQAQADAADRARARGQARPRPTRSASSRTCSTTSQQAVANDLCPKTPEQLPGALPGRAEDLHDDRPAQAGAGPPGDPRPRGRPGPAGRGPGLGRPANGHIVAIASSSNYSQTTFDYATQAHRQPGSSFKVFALMTLIHDYHGDPNQTYYTSKFLPAGWLPADPTWSVHTAEETYQGDINITKATIVSDNTVFAQLAADLGWDKLDADRPRDGHHLAAGRQSVRGDRRSAGRRHAAGDGRRLRDARQRRHPRPGHDHQQGRVPRRQRRATSAIRRTPRCSPTARPTRRPACSSRSSPAAPARPPATAARPPARPAPPTTSRTRGSSATRRGCRPPCGSAIRRATSRWPTASAAPWRRRSGTTTCRPPAAATAATSRSPTTPFEGTAVLRPLLGHRRLRARPGHERRHRPRGRRPPPPRRDQHQPVQQPHPVRPAAPGPAPRQRRHRATATATDAAAAPAAARRPAAPAVKKH